MSVTKIILDCQVSTVDSTYNLQSNSQTSKSSSSIVTTSVCSKAISSTATNGEHLEGTYVYNDSVSIDEYHKKLLFTENMQ